VEIFFSVLKQNAFSEKKCFFYKNCQVLAAPRHFHHALINDHQNHNKLYGRFFLSKKRNCKKVQIFG